MKFSELTPVEDLSADLEPERCPKCNEVVHEFRVGGAQNFYAKPCMSALCVWVHCSNCNEALSSWGPIDCPYCGSNGRHPRIRRMRHLYRVKRRHW